MGPRCWWCFGAAWSDASAPPSWAAAAGRRGCGWPKELDESDPLRFFFTKNNYRVRITKRRQGEDTKFAIALKYGESERIRCE